MDTVSRSLAGISAFILAVLVDIPFIFAVAVARRLSVIIIVVVSVSSIIGGCDGARKTLFLLTMYPSVDNPCLYIRRSSLDCTPFIRIPSFSIASPMTRVVNRIASSSSPSLLSISDFIYNEVYQYCLPASSSVLSNQTQLNMQVSCLGIPNTIHFFNVPLASVSKTTIYQPPILHFHQIDCTSAELEIIPFISSSQTTTRMMNGWIYLRGSRANLVEQLSWFPIWITRNTSIQHIPIPLLPPSLITLSDLYDEVTRRVEQKIVNDQPLSLDLIFVPQDPSVMDRIIQHIELADSTLCAPDSLLVPINWHQISIYWTRAAWIFVVFCFLLTILTGFWRTHFRLLTVGLALMFSLHLYVVTAFSYAELVIFTLGTCSVTILFYIGFHCGATVYRGKQGFRLPSRMALADVGNAIIFLLITSIVLLTRLLRKDWN